VLADAGRVLVEDYLNIVTVSLSIARHPVSYFDKIDPSPRELARSISYATQSIALLTLADDVTCSHTLLCGNAPGPLTDLLPLLIGAFVVSTSIPIHIFANAKAKQKRSASPLISAQASALGFFCVAGSIVFLTSTEIYTRGLDKIQFVVPIMLVLFFLFSLYLMFRASVLFVARGYGISLLSAQLAISLGGIASMIALPLTLLALVFVGVPVLVWRGLRGLVRRLRRPSAGIPASR
jgi:hypothetical protein